VAVIPAGATTLPTVVASRVILYVRSVLVRFSGLGFEVGPVLARALVRAKLLAVVLLIIQVAVLTELI
jgi:hypothetical protein